MTDAKRTQLFFPNEIADTPNGGARYTAACCTLRRRGCTAGSVAADVFFDMTNSGMKFPEQLGDAL